MGTSLACQINFGGPPPPPTITPLPTATPHPTVEPVPTRIPQPTQESISTNLPPTPGDIEIVITEAQLNEIAKQQLQSESGALIQNPDVRLNEGSIDIYGQAKAGFITGNIRVTMTAKVDDQAKPKLTIQSADFGALPVPQSVLDQFSEAINQKIADQINSEAPNLRLEDIQIYKGQIVVKGHNP